MGTDPLLRDAKEISLQAGVVRASLIQSKLHISYTRAAFLADVLVELGFCETDYDYDLGGRRLIPTSNNDSIAQTTPPPPADLPEKAP